MKRIAISMLILLFPGWASTQNCPYEVGQWGYGPVAAIEVEDNLGLVASGAVLQVVDVSQPVSLQLLGELTLPGVIESMAQADGDQAVVATGEHGLWLVDLSDPERPSGVRVQLGSAAGPMILVAASGTRAFAVNQTNDGSHPAFRLTILDLFEPMAPVVSGEFSREGLVEDMAAAGEMVYLAMDHRELLGVDVRDPQTPHLTTYNSDAWGTPYGQVRVSVFEDVVYFIESFSCSWETCTVLHAVTAGSLASLWQERLSFQVHHADDLESNGETLFLADGFGLKAMDLTTPERPIIGWYGSSWMGSSIVDIELAEEFALLGMADGGLRTLDITNPSEPLDVGVLGLSGLFPMRFMARTDDFLIGASYGDGLTIVDVEDPLRPRLVATDPTIGVGNGLVISGHHIFVPVRERGVEVIDITLIEAPTLIGMIPTNGDAIGVAVDGHHLFVSSDVLEVFDITDPAVPSPVATLEVTGTPHLRGDRLLLGAGDGLRIVDVSDPSSPTLLSWLETDWQVEDSLVLSMTSTDDMAFVASWKNNPWAGYIHAVDLTDSGEPLMRAWVDVGDPIVGLIAKNGYLTAGVASRGSILTYDVSNPDRPRLVSSLNTTMAVEGNPSEHMDTIGLMGAGPLAYTGLMDYGRSFSSLRVIEMSDPAQPTFIGTLPRNWKTTGIAMGDGIAVTSGVDLRVFDFEDPLMPASLAYLNIPANADQIAIVQDVAYVAGGSGGLRVIDLADPTRPHEIEDVRMECRAVHADDGFLYVAGKSSVLSAGFLKVFDLSDRRSPIEVGSLDGVQQFSEVAASQNVAVGLYAKASYMTGVSVIDLSDRSSPSEIGSNTCSGYPTAVAISGDYVFVTTGSDYEGQPSDEYGLHIFDVSNPANPMKTASVITPGDASDVTISGNLAYVADGDNGVLVFDISDPTNPLEVRRIVTPGSARAVAVDGQTLVVADGAGGLTTLNRSRCPVDDPDRMPSLID